MKKKQSTKIPTDDAVRMNRPSLELLGKIWRDATLHQLAAYRMLSILGDAEVPRFREALAVHDNAAAVSDLAAGILACCTHGIAVPDEFMKEAGVAIEAPVVH